MKPLFNKLVKHSKIYLEENSSTILTCMGVIGVIATSVSAVKSYKKYEQLKVEECCNREGELEIIDKIRIATPVYTPTIILGLGTISCIIGSNVLNKRKQATLTSAYMLLDGTFKDYRNKTKELYGEDADDRVMKELIKDEYEESEHMFTYGEKRLFFEPMSRTYFEASLAEVQQAEYLLNRELVLSDYVRVNDFLRYLGIDESDVGQVMGWSTFEMHESYGRSWIDFKHELTELEDGLECYIIKYPEEPKMDFMDY